MTLTPSRRLYALGAIELVGLNFCARKFNSIGAPSFLLPLVGAGVTYLLAIRQFFLTKQFSRRVVVIGIVLASVWQFLFLLKPAGFDDDVRRYLWDGRVQRLGYNPYLVVPSDPALAHLHTAETRSLNHPDLVTPYPPGAELFFRAVTAIHESTFALKLVFMICNLAIVFVLLDILRRGGEGEHWVLAYAWNPLLAIEVAGSGHVDIVGALLLIVSFAALKRGWRVTAAVTFGLAVSVKLLPIILLPLCWKRIRVRDGLLAATALGMLYLPFLEHGRIPASSLGTYVHSFRFNDPVFALLERLVDTPEFLAAMAVVVGILVATWMRIRHVEVSSDGFAWPMAASLFCAPVIYPWYLLWLLPFVRSAPTVPVIIWTVSIVPTYIVWHLRATGRLWILPGWVMPLEYGCVALAAAMSAWHRFRPPALPRHSK